jgi:hypothetical protein
LQVLCRFGPENESNQSLSDFRHQSRNCLILIEESSIGVEASNAGYPCFGCVAAGRMPSAVAGYETTSGNRVRGLVTLSSAIVFEYFSLICLDQ